LLGCWGCITRDEIEEKSRRSGTLGSDKRSTPAFDRARLPIVNHLVRTVTGRGLLNMHDPRYAGK